VHLAIARQKTCLYSKQAIPMVMEVNPWGARKDTLGAVAAVDLIGQVDVGGLGLPVAEPLVVRHLLEVQVVKPDGGAAVA